MRKEDEAEVRRGPESEAEVRGGGCTPGPCASLNVLLSLRWNS